MHVFLRNVCILAYHDVGGKAVIYVSIEAKSIYYVDEDALWVPMLVRIDVHSLSMQFISAIGL